MPQANELLEEVLRTRRAALAGYAALLTLDRRAAEDLLQEALVRTVARERTLRDSAAAEAYVRAAIRTVFLDGLRRERAWRTRAPLFAVRAARPDPDETAVAGLDVRAALASLPARERACVVLRYMDDLPVADIARALRVSDGAVKRYLADGTRTLRTVLGDDVVLPAGPEAETVPVSARTGRSPR
ncbi:RNA polymerase sigma factor [Cellulomonas sp. 179-A 4D5 NHS]|uniref:RNA polymerase sigma factor n=1 Tax=Cellulomonas sp. 179-A 4D5 NHS TaxID=3142378 RepID=UPI00399F9CD8